MRVEIVLTAHPTAITRRSLAAKQVRIAQALERQDRADLTVDERHDVQDDLRREILAMWGTEDVRLRRPTPMEEVRSGLFIFEQTLWDALPRYLRALDRALRDATGRGLPLDAAPIVFGSWIGGDRDGNPAITPAITREACAGVAGAGDDDCSPAKSRRWPASCRSRRPTPRSSLPRTGRASRTAPCCSRCSIACARGTRRSISAVRSSSATSRWSTPGSRRSPMAGWRTCCAGSRRSARRSSASTCGSTRGATPRRSTRSSGG